MCLNYKQKSQHFDVPPQTLCTHLGVYQVCVLQLWVYVCGVCAICFRGGVAEDGAQGLAHDKLATR
jgi:hypothetical protein